MSTFTATRQPAPHSALRGLIARHPVAAFLVMVYTVYPLFTLPLVRAYLPSLPFDLDLSSALGHIFGVALPAFVVMAALHGRAGVLDLAQRCLRWRVGPQWYLVALLGLPSAVLVCASAIFGLAPLHALLDKWPLLVTMVVPQLLLFCVFSNLPEEIGWTGFLQARLQDRHGPLKASILVTLPFALFHLPDVMVEFGYTLAQLPLALAVVGVMGITHLFARVVMMWLYNNAKYSVLLVGLFHATFNATVHPRGFGGTFIPGPDGTNGYVLLIAIGVVAVAAVLTVVFTRGRLAYQPDLALQPAALPARGDAPAPQM